MGVKPTISPNSVCAIFNIRKHGIPQSNLRMNFTAAHFENMLPLSGINISMQEPVTTRRLFTLRINFLIQLTSTGTAGGQSSNFSLSRFNHQRLNGSRSFRQTDYIMLL